MKHTLLVRLRWLPVVLCLFPVACRVGGGDSVDTGGYTRARGLYMAGSYEEGVIEAAAAYREHPEDLGGACLYARLLLQTGRPDMAEKVVQRGLRVRADDGELLLLLARCLYAAGKAGDALAVLERAGSTLILEEIFLERAKILMDFGEDKKAEASVRNALLLRGME